MTLQQVRHALYLNRHVGRRCVHEGIQQVIIAHVESQLHIVHGINYNLYLLGVIDKKKIEHGDHVESKKCLIKKYDEKGLVV